MLDFERGLIKQALAKHVLRSDYRDGIHLRPSTSARASDSKQSFTSVLPALPVPVPTEPASGGEPSDKSSGVGGIFVKALHTSQKRDSKPKEDSVLPAPERSSSGVREGNALPAPERSSGAVQAQRTSERLAKHVEWDGQGRRKMLPPFFDGHRQQDEATTQLPRKLMPSSGPVSPARRPYSPPGASRSPPRSPSPSQGLPAMPLGWTFSGTHSFSGQLKEHEPWSRWDFIKHLPPNNFLSLKSLRRAAVAKAKQKPVDPYLQVLYHDVAVLLRAVPKLLHCQEVSGLKEPPMSEGDSISQVAAAAAKSVSGGEVNSKDLELAEGFAVAMTGGIQPKIRRMSSRPSFLQPSSNARRQSRGPVALIGVERKMSVRNIADSLAESAQEPRRKSGSRRPSRGPDADMIAALERRVSVNHSSNANLAAEAMRRMSAAMRQGRRGSNQLVPLPGAGALRQDEMPDLMQLEALAAQLPAITLQRWKALLKEKADIDWHTFLDKLTKVLAQKPQWFLLRQLDRGLKTMVELAEPQPSDSPVLGGPGQVPRAALPWLSVVAVTHRLPAAAKELSGRWKFNISSTRLMFVAAALERAASYQIAGGFFLSLDVCHRVSRNLADLMPVKGGQNLSAQWLKQLQDAETIDDDSKAQAGDTVRLLAHRVAALWDHMLSPDDASSSSASSEDEANNEDVDDLPEFTEEAMSYLCKTQLGAMTEDEAAAVPALFKEAVNALLPVSARALVQHASGFSGYRAILGPLVLELLLQKRAARRYARKASYGEEVTPEEHASATEELLLELLWSTFGWDSPPGRRLLRRLCRAFTRIITSSDEGLSIAGFNRLCGTAGWTLRAAAKRSSVNSTRKTTDNNAHLNGLFQKAAGVHEGADLMRFVHLVELVAEEITQPKMGLHGAFAALELTVSEIVTAAQSREDKAKAQSQSQGSLKTKRKLAES
eukprot:TRINITY_DN77845_c0_g1_i1.p1 TRINITY_DN77845_c0_g1~~TRINITY_DN77845_c0_g1_i1.p1  ORF type:complete len:944 (+),score=208.55 TRINITY_DN77845_c0_g1_i1:116-2947(+)